MKIFISYRRDDSAGYAGRLFDYLAQHFGESNVFMDVATIRPGQDFRTVLTNSVGQCDVLLVMIGKHWLSIEDGQGGRRLDDSGDWVRTEIAAGLANPKVHVIPVLIRDARMPGAHELPEGLKELAWRNAIELSDARFRQDANHLISEIDRLNVESKVTSETPAPLPKAEPSKASRWRWAMIAIPLVALFGAALIYGKMSGQTPSPTETAELAPVATITMITDTPQPTTTATAIPRRILFEDTFVDNRHQWQLGANNFRIEFGKLIASFRCYSAAYCGSYLYIPFNFPKNFRLEVDVTAVDLFADTKIGIGFHARRNGDDFFYTNFYVEDSSYEVRATYRQNDLGLVPYTFAEMNQGIDATNRFGIELNETVIIPIINSQNLIEGADGALSAAGESYLIVYVSQGGTATIELDNLTVEEIK